MYIQRVKAGAGVEQNFGHYIWVAFIERLFCTSFGTWVPGRYIYRGGCLRGVPLLACQKQAQNNLKTPSNE